MTELRLSYSYQSAADAGENRHAVLVISELATLHGFEIVEGEPVTVADAWLFRVRGERLPERWPRYITVLDVSGTE